ncbi:MAG: (2Fe-2S)-binding protein [Acholeplasmataceae bacterium]
MNDDHIILCRCEDVTRKEVRRLLEQGYTTFEDLKRLLRVGMGPCQGDTCGHLIQQEIAAFLKVPIESVPIQKARPLTTGVPLQKIASGDDHEKR